MHYSKLKKNGNEKIAFRNFYQTVNYQLKQAKENNFHKNMILNTLNV